MKSYIKSIIFLSAILAGCNYVCGMEDNKKPKPVQGRTIIATFDIANENVNQDVKIINDRDGDMTNTRTDIDRIGIYKLGNNNEYQVEHIYDKDKGVEINKCHNFSSAGRYKIYYYFKEGVKDMSGMFYECFCLTSLDFIHFDAANVTNMSFMFY